MNIQIKNYRNAKVLYVGEHTSIKQCVVAAVISGADLYGADLTDTDLHGATLHGAKLRGADLTSAKLHGAILHGAKLSGANLTDADLHGAILCSAELRGANLTDADLHGAILCGAELRGANLTDALFTGADLSGARLSDTKGTTTNEESIARLDEIREHVIVHGDELKMGAWHGTGWDPDCEPEHACKTSHCLAGWAQALCPDKSIRELDPITAGVRLIPLAAGRFWGDAENTKKWLESRAYAHSLGKQIARPARARRQR
ncbi:MAG: pentapeptide repeat-containing protein [Verrucomicrobiales bacterium]|nr:pentapeptide repeat-containing protein [Verrucomicrobiales bacterium]